MPCEPLKNSEGTTIGFACSRGTGFKPAPCIHCARPHTKLCDHKYPSGVTCDAKLCAAHAVSIGPDKDLCPRHAQGGAKS